MLADIIANLEQMKHDELRDFIDYCEWHYLAKLVPIEDKQRDRFYKSVKNRRTGLPTGGFPDSTLNDYKELLGLPVAKLLQMRTRLQQDTKKLIQQANDSQLGIIFGLPGQDDRTAGAIAWVLLRSKAPIIKNSQGNIQVKHIPYWQIVTDDEGNIVIDEDTGKPAKIKMMGAYLYLRYWTVQGDSDRQKKRYKSLYIGGKTELSEKRKGGYIYRPLADYFEALIKKHGNEHTRQVTDKKTGEIKTQVFSMRPRGDDNPIAELEVRIIGCIDMNNLSSDDAINHECLQQLQLEVCG